jgi:lipopolysaccharide/colanic/teichoic acid biosynthesis glycosyltransferase
VSRANRASRARPHYHLPAIYSARAHGSPRRGLDVSSPTTFPPRPLILRRRQLPFWEATAKRALDVVVAATLLVILSPLMGLIALAIKLTSRGPVLFRQERVGQHGRPFEMLKFRTMLPDRRRVDLGPPPGMPERRRTHKSRGDPRVTPLGRLLRRTCLDELPQLWNVLTGEMSLVGPRPELPSIVADYEPWQHLRHTVRPGVTGWWQVNRRDGRPMHQATELDLYYVEHQSISLDLHILAMTVGAIIDGSGVF